MSANRKVEVFTAGCAICDELAARIKELACPSCEILELPMADPTVAIRAKVLGVRSVPAVVIDGRLADCCAGRGPDEAALRAAGLGQPLP